MNPLHPGHMTAAERLDEVAEILAAGLMRLRARKSSPLSAARGESSLDFSPTRAVMPTPSNTGAHGLTDTVLARLAALKTTADTDDLKQQWRDLFETEPPPYNRRFLEHRLAYRIQELAYGGLKPETLERLRRSRENSTMGIPSGGANAPRTGRSPARG